MSGLVLHISTSRPTDFERATDSSVQSASFSGPVRLRSKIVDVWQAESTEAPSDSSAVAFSPNSRPPSMQTTTGRLLSRLPATLTRPFSSSPLSIATMDLHAITQEVGGALNVKRLEAISRDFRSASTPRPFRLHHATLRGMLTLLYDSADTITIPRCVLLALSSGGLDQELTCIHILLAPPRSDAMLLGESNRVHVSCTTADSFCLFFISLQLD